MVRTYAPAGQTPVIRSFYTRDHLAAISAITLAGDLHLSIQTTSVHAEDAAHFLEHLLRQIPGKLLAVWDGSQMHRSHAVRDLLAAGATERIHLEQLPGYAPDLNPDEGIWRYLKRVELRNLACADLDELRREMIKAVKRLRHKRHIIRSCFGLAGLPI